MRFTLPASVLALAVTVLVGITPIFAGPSLPSVSVVPALYSFPVGGRSDFTVYVRVSSNEPVSDGFYNLYPAFVVTAINNTVTDPTGVSSGQQNLVTCTTEPTVYENVSYPGYPSRSSVTECSGLYPGRVDPRAYWGSNTAIYFLGLVIPFGPTGTWTITFTVTGLYYGNTVTLNGSAHFTVTSS